MGYKDFMRLPKDTWDQIKAGYAAGIGLREIARKMNVPEGTVLARAKREGWTQQIAAAKQAVVLPQSNAITPNAINRGSDARAGRTLP